MINLLQISIPFFTIIKRALYSALLFLRNGHILISLSSLMLYGCATSAPKNYSSEFYQDGHGSILRVGEKVLFYDYCGYGKAAAITNQRFLYITPPPYVRHKTIKSIEHVEIRTIDWIMGKSLGLEYEKELDIYTYDSSSANRFECYHNKEEISQVIQQQIDVINKIRDELDISIPDLVSPNELLKINEPVIEVLNAEYSNKTIKQSYGPGVCPDISGLYYDRAYKGIKIDGSEISSNADYSKILFDPNYENERCRLGTFVDITTILLGDYKKDVLKQYIYAECSLWYWFFQDLYQMLYQYRVTNACDIKKIRLSKLVNSTLEITLYDNDRAINKKTLYLNEEQGQRCIDGGIIISDVSGSYYFDTDRQITTIASADDGSLILNSAVYGEPHAMPLYPPFFIPLPGTDSVIFYRWVKADGEVNPYRDCQ